MVVWMPALPLMVDKKLDFWPAMEASRRIVHANFWGWFGLGALNFLVALAGNVACIVGVFVALPICFAAVAYAYEDVVGKPLRRAG